MSITRMTKSSDHFTRVNQPLTRLGRGLKNGVPSNT
jgi:hypothetical protein